MNKHKNLASNCSLLLFAVFSLYSLVLTPLFIKADTDVAFGTPFVQKVLLFLIHTTEITGILIAYAFIIYAAFAFGMKKIFSFVGVFEALTFYKYFSKYSVNLLFYGAGGSDAGFILAEIFYLYVLPFILENVQLFVFILAVLLTRKHAADKNGSPSGTPFGSSPGTPFGFFPFRKLADMKNPPQRAASYACVIVALSKALQFVYADIVNPRRILISVLSYLSAAMLGAASYMVITFIMIRIYEGEAKKICEGGRNSR